MTRSPFGEKKAEYRKTKSREFSKYKNKTKEIPGGKTNQKTLGSEVVMTFLNKTKHKSHKGKVDHFELIKI